MIYTIEIRKSNLFHSNVRGDDCVLSLKLEHAIFGSVISCFTGNQLKVRCIVDIIIARRFWIV